MVLVMVDQVRDVFSNDGQVEQVFLLNFDLVLVGVFIVFVIVQMLCCFGIWVEVFVFDIDLQGICDNLCWMGQVLGCVEQVQWMIVDFDVGFGSLFVGFCFCVVIYVVNGYSLGSVSFVGQIVVQVGFDNIVDELGLS